MEQIKCLNLKSVNNGFQCKKKSNSHNTTQKVPEACPHPGRVLNSPGSAWNPTEPSEPIDPRVLGSVPSKLRRHGVPETNIRFTASDGQRVALSFKNQKNKHTQNEK